MPFHLLRRDTAATFLDTVGLGPGERALGRLLAILGDRRSQLGRDALRGAQAHGLHRSAGDGCRQGGGGRVQHHAVADHFAITFCSTFAAL